MQIRIQYANCELTNKIFILLQIFFTERVVKTGK